MAGGALAAVAVVALFWHRGSHRAAEVAPAPVVAGRPCAAARAGGRAGPRPPPPAAPRPATPAALLAAAIAASAEDWAGAETALDKIAPLPRRRRCSS